MKEDVSLKKFEHKYIVDKMRVFSSRSDFYEKIYILYAQLKLDEISINEYMNDILQLYYSNKRNNWREKI